MVRAMSAELIAIRDALKCGCCGETFKGTDSQARRVKYEYKTAYCSKVCRRKATKRMGAI